MTSESVFDATRDDIAEQAVLGSVIMNNDLYDIAVSRGVNDGVFAGDSNRILWYAIERMVSEQRAVDFVTLRNWLTASEELGMVGGIEYVSTLVEGVPAATNIGHYSDIVVERWRARMIAKSVIQARSKLGNGAKADEVSTLLSAALEATTDTGTQDSGRLSEFLERRVGLMGAKSLPWGIDKLDRRIGGLPEGSLVIVGAYPSEGKTAFTTCVLTKLAKAGVPVGLFSVEMSAAQINMALLGRESGLGMAHVMRGIGEMNDDEITRLTRAKHVLDKLPFWMDASPVSVNEVAAQSRVWKRKHGIKVVAVDYLQLLKRQTGEENRRIGIDASVNALKGLAQTTGLTVILLSQLARGNDYAAHASSNKLKESGGINEAADLILMVSRPNRQEAGICPECNGAGHSFCPMCHGDGSISQDTEMKVVCEKNKFGPIGKCTLGWTGKTMSIHNEVIM